MGSRIDSAPEARQPAETAAHGEPAAAYPSGAREDPTVRADGRATEGEAVDAVAGPYTLRDLVVMVSAAVVLVGALIPFAFMQALTTAWLQAGWQFNQFAYFLLPLAVGVAFGWRRLAGRTQVRVASLSLDQLGSVAAVLSAAYFFFAGINLMSPAYVLCLLGALGMVGGTAAAPYIEAFAADFAPGDGPLLARPVRPTPRRRRAMEERTIVEPRNAGSPAGDPTSGRPSAVAPTAASGAVPHGRPDPRRDGADPSRDGRSGDGRPAAAGPWDERRHSGQRGAAPHHVPADVGAAPTGARAAGAERQHPHPGAPAAAGAADAEGGAVIAAVEAPSHHGADPAPEPSEAFWFAVPAPRDAVDPDSRRPLFAVQPGEWNLALAERGDHLLVQHTDGRIGLLLDLEAIQRA